MSTAALTWRQFRFERTMFWRNPSAAFFNFFLPLLFLVLIASVFGANAHDLNILIPGIAAMSVMTTTFTSLAYNVTFLREQGVLKRIKGTPMPPVAYFGGLVANAVANAVVQLALVLVIGHFAYGVSWPQDWPALVVFSLLGVTAFAALGVALAQAIPNFDSAAAYVNAAFLPLIFISGTFYSTSSEPAALEAIANALPLKHVIDGLSGAIVTGEGIAGNWVAVLVLLGWAAVGAGASLRYFRWE
jgi:ABC-2 type transport system permease protein